MTKQNEMEIVTNVRRAYGVWYYEQHVNMYFKPRHVTHENGLQGSLPYLLSYVIYPVVMYTKHRFIIKHSVNGQFLLLCPALLKNKNYIIIKYFGAS